MSESTGVVTTYRVSPERGVWKIELAGDGFTEWAATKAEAVARARVLAARAPKGVVVVVVEAQLESEPMPKPS